MDALEIAAVNRARGALAMLSLSTGEKKKYSITRAIRAKAFGHQESFVRDAAFELECSAELEKRLNRPYQSNLLVPSDVLTRPLGAEAVTRALATTPGASGGYLVGVEDMGFVDILRARSVAFRMGATLAPGLAGSVAAARQTGTATVAWQAGDGSNTSATELTLGQLSMTPKTAIVLTDVSEQLLRQTGGAAENIVAADLAKCVATGVDSAVLNGTGGAEPLGIKNTTGVTTGQDAASATYEKVLGFLQAAGAANAIGTRPGFVTNTAGAIVLMQKQRFTSTDTPLWEGNPFDGKLVGVPAMSSEQLASGNLIFGSWDSVVIGEWGVLEIAVDTGGTRFNQAQVGIRAMWMVDVMLRYPQAFVVSTNLSA